MKSRVDFQTIIDDDDLFCGQNLTHSHKLNVSIKNSYMINLSGTLQMNV